nr:hypothetical protein [uncultured Carboxylicivirga sp.]
MAQLSTQPDQSNHNQTNQSLSSIPRNTIYNEDILIFTYERIFPQTDKFGLTLKGGILIFDPFLWVADVGIITGSNNHYFETALGGIVDPTFGDFGFVTIRANYRYQAPKGFVFKIGAIAGPPDNFILPIISFGYAF